MIFQGNPSVQRAYLARVVYGDASEFHVCLCIESDAGEDPALVKAIGREFASFFRTDEHLDTLFIRDEHEAELKLVCAPFYVGA